LWEAETSWHRSSKDQFPAEWQEVVCEGGGGERHIADILTTHGLVIEFQHSRLPRDQRQGRESFYGNMVWVVDGTRLARDVTRFLEFKDHFSPTMLDGLQLCSVQRSFPADWSCSAKLVVFDFTNEDAADPDLWCLFPGRLDGGKMLVASLPKRDFLRMALEQSFIFEVEGIIALMEKHYLQEDERWFGRSPRQASYRGRRLT
jgi:hypothetical protein